MLKWHWILYIRIQVYFALSSSIYHLSVCYTHIREGYRLYKTTLKLYQYNKIKVVSHSHHNPIWLFLFRKHSTPSFHHDPPLGPQGPLHSAISGERRTEGKHTTS